MRRLLVLSALLALASISFADDEQILYPRHILAPIYPAIARTAHVTGDIVVRATLDADGNITAADYVSGPALLKRACLDSVRSWSFSKPPHDGLTQTVICSFKLDDSISEGSRDVITFDLPNRVTVATHLATIQTQESRQR